jgi:hypothetical protein
MSLPRVEQVLLLRTLLVVSSVRLALWLLPIAAVRRMVLTPGKRPTAGHPVPLLVWAVRAVSRTVPFATCLTQALALQYLLMRSGHASKIHIGARKDPAGKFEAHAWVECEDQVVIGGAGAQGFVPLTSWKGSF